MSNCKRIISLLLSVILVLSVLTVIPVIANAAEADVAETGKSGTTGDCIWTLDGTELTISGSGAMEDYANNSDNKASWGTNITKVTISDGVTSIGSRAFFNCVSLAEVSIPETVTAIGGFAFS